MVVRDMDDIYTPDFVTETASTCGDYYDEDIENILLDVRRKKEFSGSFNMVYEDDEFEDVFIYDTIWITKVLYNDPVTVVFWSDGTKTISKCHENDIYNPETGLSICCLKKFAGGKHVRELFLDWLPTQGNIVTVNDVRRKHKC